MPRSRSRSLCMDFAATRRLRRLGRRLRIRCQHAEAEDRAARADDAVEVARGDLVQVVARLAVDVLDELPLVAPRERIALDEALGEADDAHLEAAGELRPAVAAERDFHAAAADVDHHGVAVLEIDAVRGGLVNEPRFLGAGNHPDVNAGLPRDGRDELAAVFRFADGARRRGDDLVNLVRLGETTVLR